MLPLPPFVLHRPRTVDEAARLLEEHGSSAALVAGGTDLLPNMKLGLAAPRHVVSLGLVDGLSSIRAEEGAIRIGAMTRLEAVSAHEAVRLHAAALAEACLAVGGPHHRRMGTLGGNLALDTRCRYYNQSRFWRKALGFCLKKDGTACHVVAGGHRCVAAASNDSAAAVIALEARVVFASARGTREIAASELYVADGAANLARRPGEILVEVVVPIARGRSSAYEKLRARASIDFPMLSVAASVTKDEGRVVDVAVVVSALAAKPRVVAGARERVAGEGWAARVERIARAAYRECKPLENVPGDAAYRREMVPVIVRKALGRVGEA